MEEFTITELSYAIIAIMGGLSGLLLVIWKSRCKTINLCWGGVDCQREVEAGVLSTNRLEAKLEEGLEMNRPQAGVSSPNQLQPELEMEDRSVADQFLS